MSRTVYLHIGAPKTGTTYLQDRLTRNAASLAEHDVHFPTKSPLISPGLFHFRAALDLLGQDWGGDPGHADGSWDALVKRVKRRSGTVVISHEILAPGAAPPRRPGDERPRGRRHPRRLHRPRPRPAAARRLAGEHQAGPQVALRTLPAEVRARQDLVLAGLRPARRCSAPGARTSRPRTSTSSPSRPTRGGDVAVGPLLPGDRDRPDLGARARARGPTPRSASPRPRCSASSTSGSTAQTRRESAYDALIRRDARRGGAGPRRLAADHAAARRVRLGRRTAATSGWSGSSRPASTSSATSPTWCLSGPPADEPWHDPDRVKPRKRLAVAMEALAAMTSEAAARPDPEQRLGARVRKNAERLRSR